MSIETIPDTLAYAENRNCFNELASFFQGNSGNLK
jgi:hypothetical protein